MNYAGQNYVGQPFDAKRVLVAKVCDVDNVMNCVASFCVAELAAAVNPGCLLLRSIYRQQKTFAAPLWGDFSDADLHNLVIACPFLEELSLYKCRSITDASMRQLADSMSRLKTLDLHSCELLTPAALAAIARHCGGTLEYLCGNF